MVGLSEVVTKKGNSLVWRTGIPLHLLCSYPVSECFSRLLCKMTKSADNSSSVFQFCSDLAILSACPVRFRCAAATLLNQRIRLHQFGVALGRRPKGLKLLDRVLPLFGGRPSWKSSQRPIASAANRSFSEVGIYFPPERRLATTVWLIRQFRTSPQVCRPAHFDKSEHSSPEVLSICTGGRITLFTQASWLGAGSAHPTVPHIGGSRVHSRNGFINTADHVWTNWKFGRKSCSLYVLWKLTLLSY
jgi:hypothetical protein